MGSVAISCATSYASADCSFRRCRDRWRALDDEASMSIPCSLENCSSSPIFRSFGSGWHRSMARSGYASAMKVATALFAISIHSSTSLLLSLMTYALAPRGLPVSGSISNETLLWSSRTAPPSNRLRRIARAAVFSRLIVSATADGSHDPGPPSSGPTLTGPEGSFTASKSSSTPVRPSSRASMTL